MSPTIKALKKIANKKKLDNLLYSELSPIERKDVWIDAFKQHINYLTANLDVNNSLLIDISSDKAENHARSARKINFALPAKDQDTMAKTAAQIDNSLNYYKAEVFKELNSNKNNFISQTQSQNGLKSQIQSLVGDMNIFLTLQDDTKNKFQSQLADLKDKFQQIEESLKGTSIKYEMPVIGESEDNGEVDEYFDAAEEQGDRLIANHKPTLKRFSLTSKTEFEYSNLEDNKRDSGISSNLPKCPSHMNSGPEINDSHTYRTTLPAPMIDRSKISLWSIAKHFIGKELTKITMPVILCEPLSFLQRLAESNQYCSLMTKIYEAGDPCKRMELVAARAVSLGTNIERIYKPFNPLLGETFECVRVEQGFRSVCEQVSHHPPITAAYTESLNPNKYWKSYSTINPKIKFWGKWVEVEPQATITIDFPDLNETYTWKPVSCFMQNVVFGTPWFEYVGTMEIKCIQTGYKAIINFRPYSRTNRNWHRFDGYVYDSKMKKLKALYGEWSHCMYSCDVETFESYTSANIPLPIAEFDRYFNKLKPVNSPIKNLDELWIGNPMPPYAQERYYNFSYYTMSLNELTKNIENRIAPTDSRFRPDIRLLEHGDLDGSAREKSRIEEKQREAMKRQQNLGEYKPKWFYFDVDDRTGEKTFLFNGKYWLRDYSDCSWDLF